MLFIKFQAKKFPLLWKKGYMSFFPIKEEQAKEFDMSYFKKVYEGQITSENETSAREELFFIFNCQHPEDYKG